MHGQGHVLRPAPRTTRRSSPSPRGPASATSATPSDRITREARRAALLPARDSGAGAARRQLRCSAPRPAARPCSTATAQLLDAATSPPLYTEPGWNMHTGAEIGIDDFQANRSPEHRYRTTPLAGRVDAAAKGGFYHDGRFADAALGRAALQPDVQSAPQRPGDERSGRVPEISVRSSRTAVTGSPTTFE